MTIEKEVKRKRINNAKSQQIVKGPTRSGKVEKFEKSILLFNYGAAVDEALKKHVFSFSLSFMYLFSSQKIQTLL